VCCTKLREHDIFGLYLPLGPIGFKHIYFHTLFVHRSSHYITSVLPPRRQISCQLPDRIACRFHSLRGADMVKHVRLRYARVAACTWQQCMQSPYCIQQGTCTPTSQSPVHYALVGDPLWCWSDSSGRWGALRLVSICKMFGNLMTLPQPISYKLAVEVPVQEASSTTRPSLKSL
jgi:hypothetical protein